MGSEMCIRDSSGTSGMGRELEAANSDEENERTGIADKLKVGVVNKEGREQTWRPKTREKLAMDVVPTMLKNRNLKKWEMQLRGSKKQMIYRCMDQVGS